ncbi:MAG: SHD1 domain-containing protein [Pontiella sp.]
MNKVLIVVIMVLGFVFAAQAEMRIWTSVKGDTIEAEYIKLFAGKVILNTPEGKQLKVPISGLCNADKEWLANAVPPKIKISVDMDKDSDTLSSYSGYSYDYQTKAETVKGTVKLDKTNQEPCNREFTARMYVIGKETTRDLREVISFAEHTFSFKTSKTTTFKTTPATVEYTKSSYSVNRGLKYEGYLVVVEDQKGGIVAFESSQSSYEKNVHKFKSVRKGTKFDRDFDITNPNQTNKKRKNN